MPWVYVRRQIATRWGIPPWMVDESPIGELETELTILQIEAEAGPPRG